MVEIKPMLLSEVFDKKILADKTKIFQQKFNGVRALVHVKDGMVVGIRNRSNAPILYCFPEFKNKNLFPYQTAILDAEICVMKDGKSVFYGGIDKRRSVPSDSVMKEYPATIIVFDALLVNGESLLMKPYKVRYEKLSVITQNELVKVAENYYDGQALWEKVVKENLEGVVIKEPNAPYELDTRSKRYLKFKNYHIAQVTVQKTEPNEKGTKIYADLNGIAVEVQLGGVFSVEVGSTHYIKYLDIVGNRLVQPTKVSREQLEAY